jgi:high-affinity K+ transport system ATPase subunit B
MTKPKVELRNPMVWIITVISAISPFVLDRFIPGQNKTTTYYMLFILVIPLAWLTLWKLYLKSLKSAGEI